jgi:pimeloyl-ACP methyl ester carboxylesterase
MRDLSYDDVGDPEGTPVVFLHGTPDSRLSRHPDDGLAASAGVRLLAVDRPGYGGTSPGPFGDRVAALLEKLGIERAAVVAWSGGALAGLELAATSGWATSLHIVGGLVPVEAYDDPDVRAAAEARLGLLEMSAAFPPDELAAAVAPMLAPYPCDHALALEHQREHRDPAEQARIAAVPGAVDRMADGLVEAVRLGLAGVEADLVDQVRPLRADLREIAVPVQLWYGAEDQVTPPAFGEWYAGCLRTAALRVVPGAGHYLPLTHWPEILATLPSR